MINPAFLSDPNSASQQAIAAARRAHQAPQHHIIESQPDFTSSSASAAVAAAHSYAAGTAAGTGTKRNLDFRALFCDDTRDTERDCHTDRGGRGAQQAIAAGVPAAAHPWGPAVSDGAAVPQVAVQRGPDPTRKRRMFLVSKSHELKAVTGADVRSPLTILTAPVFLFMVHEKSTSAFATPGLRSALSLPHLQTLNNLSKRPNREVIIMPQPDDSVVFVQPGDDEFYLSCSEAANIAFSQFTAGYVAAERPAASAHTDGGMAARGGGKSVRLGGGLVPQRFEKEILPSGEDSDSDASVSAD